MGERPYREAARVAPAPTTLDHLLAGARSRRVDQGPLGIDETPPATGRGFRRQLREPAKRALAILVGLAPAIGLARYATLWHRAAVAVDHGVANGEVGVAVARAGPPARR